MDIDLLRTFLEVRRLGNFRSAAENLHVTQAAVSQRIKHLETLLDAPLFVREKNNIVPTPAGEHLVDAAESIVATWQRARQDIGLTAGDGPRLAIAAPAGIWALFANRWLDAVMSRWPEATYRTSILPEDVAIRRVLARTQDLAFVLSSQGSETLWHEALGGFELALFSRRKRTLVQALACPYVHVDWGRDMGPSFGAKLGFGAPAQLHTNDYVLAAEYAATHDGVALLPVAAYERGGRLKCVEGSPRIRRQVHAVWSRRGQHGHWVREVIDMLSAPAPAGSVEV